MLNSNADTSPPLSIKQSSDNISNINKVLDMELNSNSLKGIENEHPKHPTTYLQTLTHMLKGNIATGVFAMGDAFKNAGLILGPILTVFLGVVAVFNQHILLDCAEYKRKNENLNYVPNFDDTVFYCFKRGPFLFKKLAKHCKITVNICLILASLGFCSVYFVFVSTAVKQVFETLTLIKLDVHLHMVVVLFVILLFSSIRNLKFLAPVSLLATILIFFGIATTLYLSMSDLPPITSRKPVGKLVDIPLFFGTALYCFEGISLVLPLQREMKNPQNFKSPLGVLNLGMIIVTVTLLTTGIVGYLKYGDNVEGSLTLNLPSDDPLSLYVKVSVAIGVLLTYPIMLYVPVILTWPMVERKWGPFKKPLIYHYILRFSLVLSTFFMAEIIPNLGLFISLCGSVTSTTLAFMIPPLIDIAVRWGNDFGFCYWRLFVDIFTLFLGCYGICTGAYTSIISIFSS